MKQLSSLYVLLMAVIVLSGCGGSDSKTHSSSSSTSSSESSSSEMSSSSMAAMVDMAYTVTVTNLTTGQPLSPVGYVLHKPEYSAFSVGMRASVGLEMLAESGDAAEFLEEANALESSYMGAAGAGVIMPGMSEALAITLNLVEADASSLALTLLAMPVNTNDGFTGINAVNIGGLAVGESKSFDTLSYDAGTEMNTETVATIPGPAAGGEGFNAERDDPIDQVTMHPGVVTQDDGKSDSVLTHQHRWDNPVARITVTRIAP